jgi:hypothetical protein
MGAKASGQSGEVNTSAPSAPPDIEGEPGALYYGETSKPEKKTPPKPKTPPKVKSPTHYLTKCCGIKLEYKSDEETCFHHCYKNVPWKEIFQFVLTIVIWLGAATGAIYLIATRQQVINECTGMSNFERHNCLNQRNNSLLEYAFGFCLMFFAVLKFTLIFVRHTPETPFACVNGFPNKSLAERFCFWMFIVLTLVFLFVLIYCAQFLEDCPNAGRDDDSTRRDICQSYKENDLAGQLTGAVLSGLAFSASCFLWIWWLLGGMDCGCK